MSRLAGLALLAVAVVMAAGCVDTRYDAMRAEAFQKAYDREKEIAFAAARADAYARTEPLAFTNTRDRLIVNGHYAYDRPFLLLVLGGGFALGFAAQYIALWLIRRRTHAADIDMVLLGTRPRRIDLSSVIATTTTGGDTYPVRRYVRRSQ